MIRTVTNAFDYSNVQIMTYFSRYLNESVSIREIIVIVRRLYKVIIIIIIRLFEKQNYAHVT